MPCGHDTVLRCGVGRTFLEIEEHREIRKNRAGVKKKLSFLYVLFVLPSNGTGL